MKLPGLWRSLCGGTAAGAHRYVDGKAGFSRSTVAVDQAPVLADELLGNGEAQAAAIGASGNHREEDVLDDLGGNTRPVVDHVDPAHQRVVKAADGALAL